MTPDLSLVPTEALVQALKDRHDAMIFVGHRKEEKPGVDVGQDAWHGNSILCVGLAMGLIRAIQDWEREGEDDDEDDE